MRMKLRRVGVPVSRIRTQRPCQMWHWHCFNDWGPAVAVAGVEARYALPHLSKSLCACMRFPDIGK